MSYTPYPQTVDWQQPGMQAPPQRGSNGLAVAGFVLGLLGFLGSFIPIVNIGAIVLAVVGLILAAIGLAKAKTARAGKGLAVAGVVLSVLGIIIAIAIDVVVGAAVHTAAKQVTDTTVTTPSTAGHKGGTAASGVGRSRSNPAPLNSAISGDDWSVTINSVKTVSHDSLGSGPAAGKLLLDVNLTATYQGHDAQGDSSATTVKYVSPDGRTFDDTDGSTLFIPNHEFSVMKTLYHGASETGDDLIEIPASDWQHGVLAVSPALLSDDTFVSLK